MIFGDIVLVCVILALCVILPLIFVNDEKNENTVVVSVDGVKTHEISLFEDTVFSPDGGHTYVTVRDGEAFISKSDCPDGLCMKMRKADSNGGSVICLPNRVSVSVKGQDATEGADVYAG